MQRSRTRNAAGAALALALLIAALPGPAASQVRLSITKGFGEKVIIAIPLFQGGRGTLVNAQDVRTVLRFDLETSGYFSAVENLQFVDDVEADDRLTGRIDYVEWNALGAEVLVKGKITGDLENFSIEASVHDLAQGQGIMARRYSGKPRQWRAAVHSLADDIVRQLTGEPGIAASKIAFVSDVTGVKQLYVMDYDGENQTRVVKDDLMSMYPDWFSDKDRLVYTRFRGSRQEAYVVRSTTGEQARLTSFPGLNAFVAVSPRGNEYLMTLSRDGNPEIYRLAADGSDPRRLTFNKSTESSPRWSPDGRRVVFVSDRAGSPQIYVMSASGGTAERVTYQGSYNTSPDWSPKGDLIAYTARVEGVFQIHTVDVNTKEVVRLTTGGGHKEDPSWAPDGRHLVYSVRSRGKSDLTMLDIYELEPLQLTSGGGDYLSPAWTP